MAIQKQSYQIAGMRQDNLVGTGFSSKFAHEIMNMRLNTIGDYTTASWTTEKGTKELIVQAMPNPKTKEVGYKWFPVNGYNINQFHPIGQAAINDEWILFGKIADIDAIINLHYNVVDNEESLYGRILYAGNLNFDINYPIETLTFYENELVQKVYWTDGINQPRVINIKGAEGEANGFKPLEHNINSWDTQFDFVQEVSLNEQVTISKLNSGTGLFPPGTVKYAITYYKKYGPETNIVYDSPLHYPTIGDRACSPDEISGDSFSIKVDNVDTNHNFDYIRLYSIIRTSDNATPIVRIVEDKHIDDTITSVTFVDTNTTGSIIDPSILNYIGGNIISVGTFDQKNNTLFLGNISLKSKSVTSLLKDENLGSGEFVLDEDKNAEYLKVIPVYNNTITLSDTINESSRNSYYKYTSQLNDCSFGYIKTLGHNYNYKYKANSFSLKNFKNGEYYRFGIQFQDNTGKWSEVVRLGNVNSTERDSKCDIAPQEFETTSGGVYYALPVFKYILNSSISSLLLNEGYKKARLVCCYTTNSDRSFIAQGVINQAVYNQKESGITGDPGIELIKEDDAGSPYAMSSWFFRPFKEGDIGAGNPNRSYKITKEEIQSITDASAKSLIEALNREFNSYINKWGDKWPNNVPVGDNDFGASRLYIEMLNAINYGTESNISNNSLYKTHVNYWTLNSPEIELDESIRTLDSRAFNTKLIGGFDIKSRASSVYIDATTPYVNHLNERGDGLVNKTNVNQSSNCLSHNLDYCKWNDLDVFYMHGGEGTGIRNYPIIPFQRSTSLTNYIKDIDGWKCNDRENNPVPQDIRQGSKINSKVFANLIYTKLSDFSDKKYNLDSKELQIFDSNEVMPTMINNKVYYGNVNTIAPIITPVNVTIKSPISGQDDINIVGSYPLDYFNSIRTNFYTYTGLQGGNSLLATDPVSITYKSTPHAVLYGGATVNNEGSANDFYLAEIFRSVGIDQRFGGINNRNNIYLPCGNTVALNGTNNITLYGYEGDHYLMRYDCLKTYPFTTEDTNQIVDILSFMCESRINLDGRYDKNRGLVDNTIVLPTNFNLINKSYTQSNNFFSYTELRDDVIATEVVNFPNQITWTKEKVSGEDVDTWTNITLASTADADGTVGKINRIININDRLILFQDHALSQIGFNENTAISTESGVPLELAKTGKYTGLNYISREIGCQNKWSISQSKNGLFWIDDSRQEMLRYGEGIQSLSSMSGFDAFMIKELPSSFKSWNPDTFDNFVTYYDKLSNDIYFINEDYCLAWNEQSQTFTSFYGYNQIPYMVNLSSHSLIWHNGIYAARESDTYSTFFGNTKDYWMTLVCDGQTDKGSAFPADKVFNNIEYRADIYNLDGTNTNYSKSVFNKQQVWNGYQDSHECNLDGIRKFNTLRVQLPRHYGTRDRIRNPFCYIKLKQDQSINTQTDRMILHDLAVYFDMK